MTDRREDDVDGARSPTGDMTDADEVAVLRYRYRDGTVQAVLPMRVVSDDRVLVTWLAPGTDIMYWATREGADPRTVPMADRFHQDLTTAPRSWQGNGVLRVMPAEEPFQVLHFWGDDGDFAGWYVNFESVRSRRGIWIDTMDWSLDLWLDPDGTPRWKDEEEADFAVAAGHLDRAELDTARRTGLEIIADVDGWLRAIGDWRDFSPPGRWSTPPALPDDWDA